MTSHAPTAEVRSEPRFSVNQPVQITVLGTAEQSSSARVVDISNTGMRLAMEHPVAPRAVLRIEWNGRTVLGDVRHQVKSGEETLIGVRLHATWESLTLEVLERERAELAQTNAQLRTLTHAAWHDLQEPLRTVATFSQLLMRRCGAELGPEGRELLGYVVDGAARMREQIAGLQQYADVNGERVDFAEFPAEAALDDAMLALRSRIAESGAAVTRDPLPAIVGRRADIAALFKHLLANAIRYSGPDSPRIHIAARQADGRHEFSVRDNGIGFEPQYCERIFELFQRLHSRAEYPGSGLGLAICKKIVECHEGRIWAESRPGEGSTFSFTIPAH